MSSSTCGLTWGQFFSSGSAAVLGAHSNSLAASPPHDVAVPSYAQACASTPATPLHTSNPGREFGARRGSAASTPPSRHAKRTRDDDDSYAGAQTDEAESSMMDGSPFVPPPPLQRVTSLELERKYDEASTAARPPPKRACHQKPQQVDGMTTQGLVAPLHSNGSVHLCPPQQLPFALAGGQSLQQPWPSRPSSAPLQQLQRPMLNVTAMVEAPNARVRVNIEAQDGYNNDDSSLMSSPPSSPVYALDDVDAVQHPSTPSAISPPRLSLSSSSRGSMPSLHGVRNSLAPPGALSLDSSHPTTPTTHLHSHRSSSPSVDHPASYRAAGGVFYSSSSLHTPSSSPLGAPDAPLPQVDVGLGVLSYSSACIAAVQPGAHNAVHRRTVTRVEIDAAAPFVVERDGMED